MKSGSKMKTVSIIVPVYNMDAYLDRCLESITRQTFADFEVLLVDDGSTDGSGRRCDEWEQNDPRIRVIHKDNGGLSDARNAGLNAAEGEFIAFVDSDDYLAKDMLEKLLAAITKQDAEMGICGFLCVDENGELISDRNEWMPIQDEVITGTEAIRKTFQKKGWYYTTPWNKLYRRELFSELRFPKGKIHEDDFVAHLLLGSCRRIACIHDIGYYYVQRAGSIIHSRSQKSNLHASEAYLDRARYTYARQLPSYASQAYFTSAMFLSKVYSGRVKNPALRSEARRQKQAFRSNLYLRQYCSKKEKMQICAVCFSPWLYRRTIMLRDRLRLYRNRLRWRTKVW